MKRKYGIGFVVCAMFGVFLYWNRWNKPIPKGIIIDKLIVHKHQRKLYVYAGNKLIKDYSIALGGNPIGDKKFEGDNKTPEGIYQIFDKNPESSYHKNLGVSYPDQVDIQEASKLGKPVGGDIKVHGLKNGYGFLGKIHRLTDWTAGCIALTDEEIDELYEHTRLAAIIEIKP